jgi:SAM-dependent methyltransferase
VVAGGGWAGAAFVSLAAPVLFSDLHEWPLALLLLSATLVLGRRRERAAAPPRLGEERRLRLLRALVLAITAGTLVNLFARELVEGFDAITFRNSYGTYRITERAAGLGRKFDAGGARVRFLLHGGTVHGIQVTDGAERRTPLGYYHPASPVGHVLGALEGDRRVAVVGLGAGASAAYFDAGDEVVFYELDPDGEAIARAHFGYLADSAARIRVEVGDARLGLARDPLAADASYDLVFVDAFSGDSIPSHLLTREALELYLRKLRPDGLLLFHVSSRFYDFNPVLKAAGDALGLHGAHAWSSAPLEPLEMAARCYALARDPKRIAPLLALGWTSDASVRPATPWTDDYVNVLAPLWSRLRGKLAARP